MMMEYSLCFRSSSNKPPIPAMMTQSRSITTTNKISARLPITKLPFATTAFSKPIIMSTGAPNDHDSQRWSSSRAQIGMACAAVGAFYFGTARMIGARKASASSDYQSGGDGEQRRFSAPPVTKKHAVLSLSKTRWYLLASSSADFSQDFDIDKIKALDKIKTRKVDVEKALRDMKKNQHISNEREANYDIKLEVVEILIAQGNLTKALKILETLETDIRMSDPRPSLYKAIIYSIQYNKENPPAKHWEDFIGMDELPERPPSEEDF